jgi:hypothetical protein
MSKWRTSTTVDKHLVGFVPIESEVEAHVALWRLALDHRVPHRRQHLTTELALTYLTRRTESGCLGVLLEPALAAQLFGIKQTSSCSGVIGCWQSTHSFISHSTNSMFSGSSPTMRLQ